MQPGVEGECLSGVGGLRGWGRRPRVSGSGWIKGQSQIRSLVRFTLSRGSPTLHSTAAAVGQGTPRTRTDLTETGHSLQPPQQLCTPSPSLTQVPGPSSLLLLTSKNTGFCAPTPHTRFPAQEAAERGTGCTCWRKALGNPLLGFVPLIHFPNALFSMPGSRVIGRAGCVP